MRSGLRALILALPLLSSCTTVYVMVAVVPGPYLASPNIVVGTRVVPILPHFRPHGGEGQKVQGASSHSPVGEWQWFNPGGSTVRINADGTTVHYANGTIVDSGHWAFVNGAGAVHITWGTGYSDTWQLSPDGSAMSGTNQYSGLPEVTRLQ